MLGSAISGLATGTLLGAYSYENGQSFSHRVLEQPPGRTPDMEYSKSKQQRSELRKQE